MTKMKKFQIFLEFLFGISWFVIGWKKKNKSVMMLMTRLENSIFNAVFFMFAY